MMNNLSGGITSKGKLNGSLAIGKIGGISECKKNVYVGESPEEYTEVWFDPSEEGIIGEVVTKKFVEERTAKLEASLDNMRNDKLYAKDFGVKADGLADDTEALQNAVDWFKPKNTNELWGYQNCGGTIILPKGNIRITKTIRLYSNIKIVGTNKVLFGRESNDTLILLDTTDSKTPAFSFVGIDTTTKKHKEALVVSGEDMDNGVVTQTWNTTLKDFTLKSKNINDLAINYSCAVKSKLENIAFENFDVDIFHSAGWDNQIINCNTLCNFSHLISQSGNTLLLKNVYVNPSTKIKDVLPMNHLLYEYVNDENLIYKNTPTGIINIGTHGLNIEKGIIEKIKVGIQSCADYHESEKFFINTSFNKIHMEHIENAFVFKNVVALINGVYAYITPYTGEQLIEAYNSHITGINIQPVKYLDLYKADETSVVNFFGCNDKWQTKTELSNAEVGKTIFASWENEAIIKTWQEKFKTVVGENTVELQYADLKEVITCEINTSKLIIHNPPESPVDVRYSNTVILDCSEPKTIYSFKARDFQEFSLIAIKGNISLNGNESGGLMNIKAGVIDPIPVGGVVKFICYNGVKYRKW